MARNQPQPLEFEEYGYGAAAAYLAQSEEGSRFAPGALEVLAGDKGLKLGEKAEGFVKGAIASEKGVETAINAYSGAFFEKRDQYKPSQLTSWYKPVLKGLKKDSKDKFLYELSKHDETIAAMKKKMAEAAYILDKKAPKGAQPQDKIDAAKETQKKYQDIFLVMATLDQYKFEGMRTDAVDATRIRELEGLAAKL